MPKTSKEIGNWILNNEALQGTSDFNFAVSQFKQARERETNPYQNKENVYAGSDKKPAIVSGVGNAFNALKRGLHGLGSTVDLIKSGSKMSDYNRSQGSKQDILKGMFDKQFGSTYGMQWDPSWQTPQDVFNGIQGRADDIGVTSVVNSQLINFTERYNNMTAEWEKNQDDSGAGKLKDAITSFQDYKGHSDKKAAIDSSISGQDWQKVHADNIKEDDNKETGLKGFLNGTKTFWRSIGEDPTGAAAFIAETAIESGPVMAASLFTTLLTRNPVYGSLVMATGAVSQEAGPTAMAYLQEQGVPMETREDALAVLRNHDLLAEANRKGFGKGLVVAAFELLGQASVARMYFKANKGAAVDPSLLSKIVTKTKTGTKSSLIQAGTGGGGEIFSQLAIGEEVDASDAWIEFLAEFGTAPGEAVIAGASLTKNAIRSPYTADPTDGSLTGELKGHEDLTTNETKAYSSLALELNKIAKEGGLDKVPFDLMDIDPQSKKGAKTVIDDTHNKLVGFMNRYYGELTAKGGPLNKKGKTEAERDLITLALIAKAEGRNKAKGQVASESYDALEALVGKTKEGQNLIRTLMQLDALTQLDGKGLQGGLSEFTDKFSILGRVGGKDSGFPGATARLKPIITGLAAAQTAGVSLIPQAILPPLGRYIDKKRGTYSVLDKYIKDNIKGDPLDAATGPSVIAARELEQQTKQRTKRLGDLNKRLETSRVDLAKRETAKSSFEKADLASPGSPQDVLEQALGVRESDLGRQDFEPLIDITPVVLVDLLEIVKAENETSLNSDLQKQEFLKAVEEYQKSIREGGTIQNDMLSPVIRKVVSMAEKQGVIRRRTTANSPGLNNTQLETPAISRGIADNQRVLADLTKKAKENSSVEPYRAPLEEALNTLGLNLGTDPVTAAVDVVTKAVADGVPNKAINTYLRPYVDRIIRQALQSKAKPPSLQTTGFGAGTDTSGSSVLNKAPLNIDPSVNFPKLPNLGNLNNSLNTDTAPRINDDAGVMPGSQPSGIQTTGFGRNTDVITRQTDMGRINQISVMSEQELRALTEQELLAMTPPEYNAYLKRQFDLARGVDPSVNFTQAPGLTQLDNTDTPPVINQDGTRSMSGDQPSGIQTTGFGVGTNTSGSSVLNRAPLNIDPDVNFTQAPDLTQQVSNLDNTDTPPVIEDDDGTLTRKSKVPPMSLDGPALNQMPTALDILPDENEVSAMRDPNWKPEVKRSKEAAAQFLQDRWEKATGRTTPYEYTEENVPVIADIMVAEAMRNLESDGNAIRWYDEKIKSAKAIVELVEPRVTQSAESEAMFDFALAVTSNGQAVENNFSMALEVFRTGMDTGRMPEDFTKGGNRAAAMRAAFKFYNAYQDSVPDIPIQEFLDWDYTVKELKVWVAEFNKNNGTKVKVPASETVDTFVKGSYILGPKIGQGFYQNIRGNYDPLTMDLWWMRSWNRMVGRPFMPKKTKKAMAIKRDSIVTEIKKGGKVENQLVNETLKTTGETKKGLYKDPERMDVFIKVLDKRWNKYYKDYQDANNKKNPPKPQLFKSTGTYVLNSSPQMQGEPTGPDRPYMRKVVKKALDDLMQRQIHIKTADFQALMWYPEKLLYKKMGVSPGNGSDTDYQDAATLLAKNEGITDGQIEEALRNANGDGAVNNRPSAPGEDGGVYPGPSGTGTSSQGGPGNLTRQSRGPALTSPERNQPRTNPPSVRRLKPYVEPAKKAFEIGKKGGKYEDGIGTLGEALELATALNLTVTFLNEMPKGEFGSYTGSPDSRDADGVTRSTTRAKVRVLKQGADHPKFGGTINSIQEFTSLMHEIAHGLAIERTDRVPIAQYRKAENPLVLAKQALESVKVGSFEDFILDEVESAETQTEVLQEIINLQENIDVQIAKRPELGTKGVRDMREISEYIKTDPELRAKYSDDRIQDSNNKFRRTYLRTVPEMAVDPLWVYLVNPKLLKKAAPHTARAIRKTFNNFGGPKQPVTFYSYPLATIMAIVMGVLANLEDEEEKRNAQPPPPPGALSPNMNMGALSA